MARAAIGLIETEGLVGLIEAADVAAKTADVQLLGFARIGGGLVSLRLRGDVASVQTAVQAGAAAAQRLGQVISCHVIPGPHAELVTLLAQAGDSRTSLPDPAPQPALQDLEALPVTRLRQLARQIPDLPLRGRQISRASKAELITALQRAGHVQGRV